MEFCVLFALANRKLMMQRVQETMVEVEGSVDFGKLINKSHNFAAWEEHCGKQVMVHRKGATRTFNPHISQESAVQVSADSEAAKHHVYFVTTPKVFSTYCQYACEYFWGCASYPRHFPAFRDDPCEICGLRVSSGLSRAASQSTASYMVRGKENPESFCSCSHGTGRKLGRKQAIRALDLKQKQPLNRIG